MSINLPALTKADLVRLMRALLDYNTAALKRIETNTSMKRRLAQAKVDLQHNHNALLGLMAIENRKKGAKK